MWPARAAPGQVADSPRLARAWGSLRRDLALEGGLWSAANRRPSPPAFGTGIMPIDLEIRQRLQTDSSIRVYAVLPSPWLGLGLAYPNPNPDPNEP